VRLGFAVIDLSRQHLAPTSATSAIPATVGHGQSLTQRGIEYRFSRLGLKIMRTRLNADLKTHDLSPYS
jgi:hypothetical protein